MSIIASTLRRLLEAGLAGRGYRLARIDQPPRPFAEFLSCFRTIVPEIRTVIDIGVGPGTDWLYAGFPDADLVLFEPQRAFAPHIEALAARRRVSVHYCALAEADGELSLNIPAYAATGASLLAIEPEWARIQMAQGGAGITASRVEVRTLDAMVAAVASPHVVKIDVEGAELRVLRGGPKTIAGAELVILEASVAQRLVGGADYVDIAAHMRQAGFVLVDILEVSSYGEPAVLAYLDLAFAPLGGAFLSRSRGRIG